MNTEMIFKENMAVFSERYPHFSSKVGEIGENDGYEIIRSADGYPNVLIRKESNQTVFYDPNDPVGYARKYMEDLKIKFAPFVVFMGLGLGYHLDQYMKHLGEDRNTHEIIVYEKDIELFRLALHVSDFRDILKHPNIHFFVGDESKESFVKLRTDIFMRDPYALRSIKIIPLPASISLDNSYYLEAMKVVKKAACQVMVMMGNDSFDSLLGLEHMFLNLKHIFSNPGINELYEKFTGKPGVLVAAGPSLNKNIHLLKGLEDKALIISCDASLLPLLKKGIQPHLVTSLERIKEAILFYSRIRDFKNTYFVALPILMPETIESFKGKKFIAYRDYKYFEWLENDKGSFHIGHSVANLAFQILVHLGCDPIILIGQDLAYAKDGDTHVRGNIRGSRDEDIHKRPIIELEGNDGNPVKSQKIWEIMKHKYEEDVASYQGICINATEGGARIRGTEVMTFSEAIEKHCERSCDFQDIIDKVYNQFSDNQSVKDEIERILYKTRDTCVIVEKTIGDFEDALNEARLVEQKIIRPFMRGETVSDMDMDQLLSVEKKWLELSEILTPDNDKNLFEIAVQTLNAYDIWLASELSFLKDIYTDPKILSMARVKKMKEWMAVIGSFLIFTRNVLKKAEVMIEEELGET